ncbi:hypothetical protein FGW37_17180 [Streptomyces rectiverticillatus]|uniref:hypothetical protein n=1 Tax=Streptomyces rectiverticillatus TaxID=173860 RepID=UPI0015C334F9|nr:hypothetical protein [Streptomyces rectiverticillatus]QLE73095.1 hypothetical protein FGW37_17180 [Streptomyces rectiverticillatus]
MGLVLDPKIVHKDGHLIEHAAPDKHANALSVQEAWAAFTAAVSKLPPPEQEQLASKVAMSVLVYLGGVTDKES